MRRLGGQDASVSSEELYIQVAAGGGVSLEADLTIPKQARGMVVFAHGSGSNRHSPRNRHVARLMHEIGFGTLLVSMLTVDEEAEDILKGNLPFDIALLGRRLTGVIDWLRDTADTRSLKLGIFGSSTGAAGALLASAERPTIIAAVVSRGGRPDLAGPDLGRVEAPTLLIVGGNDLSIIDLNRQALAVLHSEKKLAIIPGATHLFEEPGALEQVAQLARDWFVSYLVTNNRSTA